MPVTDSHLPSPPPPNPSFPCYFANKVVFHSELFSSLCPLFTSPLHLSPTCLLSHRPTYSLTYQPTYLLTYPPTHLPTYLPTDQPTHLTTHRPTYLLTYPPTYLPTYLPPTHLSTYLPTDPPINEINPLRTTIGKQDMLCLSID